MTIDVSTILKELGGKIDINGDVEMSDTDFLGEMYHLTSLLRFRAVFQTTENL